MTKLFLLIGGFFIGSLSAYSQATISEPSDSLVIHHYHHHKHHSDCSGHKHKFEHGHGHGHKHNHHKHKHREEIRASLTPDQQKEFDALHNSLRETLKPLRQEMRQKREALYELLELQGDKNQINNLKSEIDILHHKTHEIRKEFRDKVIQLVGENQNLPQKEAINNLRKSYKDETAQIRELIKIKTSEYKLEVLSGKADVIRMNQLRTEIEELNKRLIEKQNELQMKIKELQGNN